MTTEKVIPQRKNDMQQSSRVLATSFTNDESLSFEQM